MNKSSSFDKLVLGISNSERIALLKKMQKENGSDSQNIENLNELQAKEEERDLKVRISKESFFLRLWLKIKARFTSGSVEVLYNKYLLSNIAREVQNKNPEIIDSKNRELLSFSYENFKQLKQVADYFKPGISVYEENPGAFFVFLGSLIFPDLERELEERANPYKYSFDTEITSDMRPMLSRHMDEILQNLPADQKSRMYCCVQGIEWIKQLTHLPLDKILMKFTSISKNEHVGNIDSLSTELQTSAKVLCNCKKIYTEVLEALFLFTYQLQSKDGTSENNDENQQDILQSESLEKKSSVYVEKSLNEISKIRAFVTEIPIRNITKVAVNSSTWEPDMPDGVEDWFVKFRGQWKKIFEKKWEDWLKDRNKFQLCKKLKNTFGTQNFPQIENRPWATTWDGIQFSKEYVLGYLYAFFQRIYPVYNKTLKAIMAEGEFVYRENMNEFTDSYNMMNHIDQNITILNKQLGQKGTYGEVFESITNVSTRTIQNYSKIKSLLSTIESETENLVTQFKNASLSLFKILSGIITPNKTTKYESISNLNTIQGENGKNFRAQVEQALTGFDEASKLINEIEQIE